PAEHLTMRDAAGDIVRIQAPINRQRGGERLHQRMRLPAHPPRPRLVPAPLHGGTLAKMPEQLNCAATAVVPRLAKPSGEHSSISCEDECRSSLSMRSIAMYALRVSP